VNRTEKTAHVEELNLALAGASHVVLARFSGLSVNQATDLRTRVRQAGGRLRVVKNRLAKRAVAGTAASRLAERFTGPCALAFHGSDAVALAKTLSEFAKSNPQLELLAGVVDAATVLDVEGVKRLALLPGLNELRGQLLSVIQAPAGRLVRLLATPGAQVARALDARRQKLEGGS
jgi:large subunit ribosomal protein L10